MKKFIAAMIMALILCGSFGATMVLADPGGGIQPTPHEVQLADPGGGIQP
jgi:hypothetical protein